MIRKARIEDLSELQSVYGCARKFMIAAGNPNQWSEGYPECVINKDIENQNLYVMCERDGKIHAAFAFILGDDPTYTRIEGEWGWQMPYGTIHRLASDGYKKGVFSTCLSFCKEIIPYIRADTHRDNSVMQHQLQKYGFVQRGIIYVADGTPRLAYDFFDDKGK